jgi:hypothetical protein
VKSKHRKVIDLWSAPKVYRPEPLQKRLEKEKKRLEHLDQERFQRLAEARKKVEQNKKDRG